MNRAPLIFLGAFVALAFSWTGIILSNQIGYGGLTAFYSGDDSKAFPGAVPGLAERGKLVYQDLGCMACHTQQVRRPGFGADIEREWGTRQSVARDYIREGRVLLGSMRTGPDLRNVGVRLNDPAWHYLHLYDPTIKAPGSTMPPHRFLFERREIVGEPSPKAVLLPAPHTPPDGYEVVPTPRAEALVAYLISLNDPFAFPETENVYVEPAAEEGEAK